MEQPRKRRLTALLVLAAVAVGAALIAVSRSRAPSPSAADRGAAPIPGEAPEGRVVIEVLNASGQVGLARAATRRLRERGLDVVSFSSDTTSALDSTQVLIRRGDPAAGKRVTQALGVGGVRSAADPARLVDVTVRLGKDFAARMAAAPLGREP